MRKVTLLDKAERFALRHEPGTASCILTGGAHEDIRLRGHVARAYLAGYRAAQRAAKRKPRSAGGAQ